MSTTSILTIKEISDKYEALLQEKVSELTSESALFEHLNNYYDSLSDVDRAFMDQFFTLLPGSISFSEMKLIVYGLRELEQPEGTVFNFTTASSKENISKEEVIFNTLLKESLNQNNRKSNTTLFTHIRMTMTAERSKKIWGEVSKELVGLSIVEFHNSQKSLANIA